VGYVPTLLNQKKNLWNRLFFFLICIAPGYLFPLFAGQTQVVDFKNQIHRYHQITPRDPFSKFMEKVEKGVVMLNYKSDHAYLNSLLKELGISPYSQLLVYSTTSLQLSRISPRNPRAIYFSDDIYVGYVPGGQIEIIGIDPQLGAIPYIFNLPQAQDTTHPKIYRSKRCMNCHASKEMGGAPGLLVGSVIPGPGGGTIDAFRRNIFGHDIPFAKRFGGWHITGENPFPQSWANQTGMMKSGQIHKILNPPGKYFTWDNYPVQGSSLIPHLLLEHQVGFTNLCIFATYKFRELNDSKEDFIQEQTDQLLSYILFEKEATLPESIIDKKTRYVMDFEGKMYPDSGQNSLRQLNLVSRILDLRCSYMIFSNSFSGLPIPIKNVLSQKLFNLLSSQQDKLPSKFSYLKKDEREKIKKILTAHWEGFGQQS
jgi:hypothetical protein